MGVVGASLRCDVTPPVSLFPSINWRTTRLLPKEGAIEEGKDTDLGNFESERGEMPWNGGGESRVGDGYSLGM